MKVLFVASNPANESELGVDAEITALQAIFANVHGQPIQFIVQPQAIIENLPIVIQRHKPDVLHITAHGSGEQLSMRNGAGDARKVTAELLGGFLADHRPTVIYLNACNSLDIARGLVEKTDVAIGSSEPITNRAASAGALNFYTAIVGGKSVGAAFRTAKTSVAAMQDRPVLEMKSADNVRADKIVLHELPELIAVLTQKDLGRERSRWNVRFGLRGCPENTVQVVFFTDDDEMIRDRDDPSKDLCQVHRRLPVNGIAWSDAAAVWPLEDDMRMFAVGVTASSHTFSVGSTVCVALEKGLAGLSHDRQALSKPIIERLRKAT